MQEPAPPAEPRGCSVPRAPLTPWHCFWPLLRTRHLPHDRSRGSGSPALRYSLCSASQNPPPMLLRPGGTRITSSPVLGLLGPPCRLLLAYGAGSRQQCLLQGSPRGGDGHEGQGCQKRVPSSPACPSQRSPAGWGQPVTGEGTGCSSGLSPRPLPSRVLPAPAAARRVALPPSASKTGDPQLRSRAGKQQRAPLLAKSAKGWGRPTRSPAFRVLRVVQSLAAASPAARLGKPRGSSDGSRSAAGAGGWLSRSHARGERAARAWQLRHRARRATPRGAVSLAPSRPIQGAAAAAGASRCIARSKQRREQSPSFGSAPLFLLLAAAAAAAAAAARAPQRIQGKAPVQPRPPRGACTDRRARAPGRTRPNPGSARLPLIRLS
uniref:Uncharacterized protein n=1 Tax=Sphaerodactylus townsendi TaxID=933632 RepID=A0ACB8G8T6_9SAUR